MVTSIYRPSKDHCFKGSLANGQLDDAAGDAAGQPGNGVLLYDQSGGIFKGQKQR